MEGNARNSALAALATRASKKPVSRDELRAAWAAETKELSIDAKAMVAGLTEGRWPLAMVDEQRRGLSERATDFAITHFAERSSVYSRADVMTMAMSGVENSLVDLTKAVGVLTNCVDHRGREMVGQVAMFATVVSHFFAGDKFRDLAIEDANNVRDVANEHNDVLVRVARQRINEIAARDRDSERERELELPLEQHRGDEEMEPVQKSRGGYER